MGTFICTMSIASIFNFFMPISMAVDPNCDYYQNMISDQKYYIYNNEYPNNYGPSTSCRWTANSDIGTRIVIVCDPISLPVSNSCGGDRLSISLSGKESFSDSRNYCGAGSVSLVSEENILTVGLFSTSNSVGGKFVCTLTAIQDNNTDTTDPTVCDCGWKGQTRIVGGVETGINEYPSMAGIVDVQQRQIYCGSSIISNRYVLTAAHCLSGKQAEYIGILVGEHDTEIGNDTTAAALYAVSKFEIHPSYDANRKLNDLAIIQTVRRMVFSAQVGPVCLPFRFTNSDFYGQTVTALGWGLLFFSGPTPNGLQKVNLSVVTNTECAEQNSDNVITSRQLCTYTPGKDSCTMDSGGPLLWTDTNSKRLLLVGIISHGLACATTRPAINTRVTSYLSWIVSRTSDASYCIK